jgi:hypothetical protein
VLCSLAWANALMDLLRPRKIEYETWGKATNSRSGRSGKMSRRPSRPGGEPPIDEPLASEPIPFGGAIAWTAVINSAQLR